jgi:hypothetical protein
MKKYRTKWSVAALRKMRNVFLPFKINDDYKQLSLQEQAEALLGIIDEVINQGDIDGKSINQENLMRFNKANILALTILKFIEEVRFETPRQDMSFADSCILCQALYLHDKESRDKFNEFLSLVDSFSATPIDATTLMVQWSVDNVWEE